MRPGRKKKGESAEKTTENVPRESKKGLHSRNKRGSLGARYQEGEELQERGGGRQRVVHNL